MRILICLILSLTFYQNGYSQSKLIFAHSKGKLNTGSTPDLFIYDVNTKKTELLYKGVVSGRGEYSASISPDNSQIIVNTYQFSGWKLGIANFSNGVIGEFNKFTSKSNYEYNASWSNSGEFVAYQEFNWGTRDVEIFIADKKGGNIKQVTNSKGGDRTPCWTKDDKSLIFTSGRGNFYNIYLKSLEEKTIKNLTNNASNDFAPSSSKTEDKIAFLSDREGSLNLYVMDYDGSNLKSLTSKSNLNSSKIKFNGFEETGYWAYSTSWSKDGNHITFCVMTDSDLEIFIIEKDGTNLVQVTNNQDSDFCPVWLN